MAALRTASLRAPLPVSLAANSVGRFGPEVEVNVYFCCLEALQNASKHAGEDATVVITMDDGDGGLSFEVDDDGRGCEPAVLLAGHGFTNMRDRLEAIGGTLWITTRPGAGVHLQGHVPSRSGRDNRTER